LLNGPEQAGYDAWVSRAAAALTPEQRHINRLVLEGLRDALAPEQDWPSFAAYLDELARQNPLVLRDRLLERMARSAASQLPATTSPAPALADARTAIAQIVSARAASLSAATSSSADLLSDVQAYISRVEYLHPQVAVDPALQKQVHMLLNDPPALHDLLITHLEAVWEAVLATEWQTEQRELQRQVRVFQQHLDPETPAAETFHTWTGRALPDYLLRQGADVRQIILVPSPHNGRYVTAWYSETAVRLFFRAPPNYGVLFRSSAVGPAELRVRLAALADETRLQIIALLAEQYELHAQELIARLNLSQSSVSRHLKQLVGAGYLVERRGEGANKIYALSTLELARTSRALELLLAGETNLAEPAAPPARAEHAPELERFLDSQGRVAAWPSKQRDRLLVLGYLASQFAPGRFYSEKEVNQILAERIKTPHADHVTLRRDLYDFQFMNRERDGSRYWRAEPRSD
jgi:DNA-binding transcriptional ArsR family regulator